MKATINITTPAGKSLEGFPFEFDQNNVDFDLWNNELDIYRHGMDGYRTITKLHKGDIITIKIEE